MQLDFFKNQEINSLLSYILLPKWILWFLSFAAKMCYLKVNYLLKFCGDMNLTVWISFLTNLWLEDKSSFFSFSTFVICIIYMPLDPFINYLCLLRSDIFGLLTLNCFLRLSSQERNLEQSRKGFFLQVSIMAHLWPNWVDQSLYYKWTKVMDLQYNPASSMNLWKTYLPYVVILNTGNR